MRKIIEEALINSSPQEIRKQLELKNQEEKRLKEELRQAETQKAAGLIMTLR